MDLSSLHDRSVNDGVAEDLSSLQYVTVDEAAAAMVHKGAGALLAKVDIKHAYRNIPIHPDDQWLFGMVWEDALFINTALPFGLRSAPKIFNAIADAMEWILNEAGVSVVFHYLNDFLLIVALNSASTINPAADVSTIRPSDSLGQAGGPNHLANISWPGAGFQGAGDTPPS